MAGFTALLLKPALDAALAGAAAKGTMDMNKTKEGIKVLDDETKTSSKKKVEKIEKEPKYKKLSPLEEYELMITLVEGGLSTRELNEIWKTGVISNDQLKRLPPDLRRKIAGMTGIDIEAQLGFGNMGDDDGDDNDKDKKNKKDKEKREKLKKLKEDAEEEQREWKKKEAEFQRTDPKAKRRAEAKKTWEKARSETPTRIDVKDPKFLGNTSEQKAEQIGERMKQAFDNGTGSEWEYQHVTPRTNLPIHP